ncbi:MAG: APC family permease [Candidatus Undinarchaeales archaeon]
MPKRKHPKHPHHKLGQKSKKVTLKRDLGLVHAVSAGVGIISGAGIYALMGVATGMAGNSVWISFFFASLVAIFTGLSYAELSSMFPKDAGEFIYADHAFGKKIAFLVGWLILISGVIAISTIALGFAGYFSKLFGIQNILPVAILIIIVLSFINFYGVKETAWLNILFTIIEVGGLVLIIVAGISYFGAPGIDYLATPHGLRGLFSASALIFFAFIGFESIIKLSEETKNPEEVIPKALILSIIITTVLYILVALSAVSVMGWEALGASSSPLADVAAIAFGSVAFKILSVIALISTANTMMISMMSTSRIAYGMGAEESLPKYLARIHSDRKTPWVAISIVMTFSILFALGGNIGLVAEMTNLTIYLTFLVVNMSLIMLRYTYPDAKRTFKVPGKIGKTPILPVIGMALVLFMLYHLKLLIIAGGIIFVLLGFVVYNWYDFIKKLAEHGWKGLEEMEKKERKRWRKERKEEKK